MEGYVEMGIYSNQLGSHNELIRTRYEKIETMQNYFARLKGSYSNCNCTKHKKVLPNPSSFYAPLQEKGYGLDEDCNFVAGGAYTLISEGGKLKKVPYEEPASAPTEETSTEELSFRGDN